VKVLVALVCVFAVCALCVSAYPQVAEQFEATMDLEIRKPGRPVVRGSGTWDVDQPAGKSHLVMDLITPAYVDVDVIERYDLGHFYEVNNASNSCFEKSLVGSMPPVWGWLVEAVNRGHRDFHGHHCEVWEWKIATITLAACFSGNTPLAFAKEYSSSDYEAFLFTSFQNVKPADSKFAVPGTCTRVSEPKPFKMPSVGVPILSDSFESRILTEIQDSHGLLRGEGAYLMDVPSGKGRQFYDLEYSEGMVRVDALERYDLHERYVVDSVDGGCHKTALNSTHMPSPWMWLKYAKDAGHTDFHGFYCHLWTASFSGLRVSLCVDINDSTRPLIFSEERSRTQYVVTQFDEYIARAPSNPRAFDVPSVCA